MSFVKCFDVASMVIEDASERFKPIWKINNEHLDVFKQYCEAIDSFAGEFEGKSYDVEVDEIKMDITIALECDEIIIENENHVLYELAKRSIRFGFSVSEDGNLIVKFVFPSLWERA